MKKSCFNCIHATKSAGFGGSYYEPPEPPTAECNNDNVDEAVFTDESTEETLPYDCGQYSPEIYKCYECGKAVTAEEALEANDLWETVTVCSFNCQQALEKRMKEYLDSEYPPDDE